MADKAFSGVDCQNKSHVVKLYILHSQICALTRISYQQTLWKYFCRSLSLEDIFLVYRADMTLQRLSRFPKICFYFYGTHSDMSSVLLKLLVGSLMQLRHGIVSWFHSPSGGLLRILESREGQAVEHTVQSVIITMALALVNTVAKHCCWVFM